MAHVARASIEANTNHSSGATNSRPMTLRIVLDTVERAHARATGGFGGGNDTRAVLILPWTDPCEMVVTLAPSTPARNKPRK